MTGNSSCCCCCWWWWWWRSCGHRRGSGIVGDSGSVSSPGSYTWRSSPLCTNPSVAEGEAVAWVHNVFTDCWVWVFPHLCVLWNEYIDSVPFHRCTGCCIPHTSWEPTIPHCFAFSGHVTALTSSQWTRPLEVAETSVVIKPNSVR